MAISKISSLAIASVAKVSSLAKASMAKINSLVNVLFSNNYSISFDGTNDAVQIDGVAGVVDVDVGTMSAWVKPNGISSSRTIVTVGVNSSNFIRLWWLDSSNQVRGTIKNGGTANTVLLTDEGFADGSAWQHWATTWDTSAAGGRGEYKLYTDGVLRHTVVINGTWSGTAAIADIGKHGISNVSYWKGNIDEVAIFNAVVSVSDIYNSGTPTDLSGESGLIGYWRMEENTGTSVTDSSSNSNAGTLENSPTWSSTTP